MEEFDKIKESMIERYKMLLALKEDEICKEIDSEFSDDIDLMLNKAVCYCEFLKFKKNVNLELKEKCCKYLDYYLHKL